MAGNTKPALSEDAILSARDKEIRTLQVSLKIIRIIIKKRKLRRQAAFSTHPYTYVYLYA